MSAVGGSRCIIGLRAVSLDTGSTPTEPDLQVLDELRALRSTLRGELNEVREQLRQARQLEQAASGFLDETGEQRARLTPIGLFEPADTDYAACVLCGSHLSTPVPSVEEMHASLGELERQLVDVRRDAPRLQELQSALIGRQAAIEGALRANQEQIDSMLAATERFQAFKDHCIQKARTFGRVTYFLEAIGARSTAIGAASPLAAIRARIEALTSLLDPDAVQEKLTSIVNMISEYMTLYAAKLELEHSGSRVRLDIRKLGVVADTLSGPIPLSRMGSGENWVGYHILSHLALHQWFRLRARPVPGFLVFDQPSQAHYPPDQDQQNSLDTLPDADRAAVYRLFKLMADVAADLAPDFQLIVLDHADLREPWFEDAVVERWRGQPLIPAEWTR